MNLNEAYQKWSIKKDPDSTAEFLKAARPVLDTAVRTYVGANDPTAFSQAKLLTIHALRGYDPKRGTQLRTHLLTQLQPLRRFAASKRILHVPERVQWQLAEVDEARKKLQDQLGHEPDIDTLADRTGLSVAKLRKLQQYQHRLVPETDEGVGIQRGNNAWADYVYADLSPMDRRIFEMRTGYNGKKILSNNQIAKQLGMTPGAVTQRVNRIAAELERGFK